MPARTLFNHLLQHNPAVCRDLAGYHGLVFELNSEYFSLRGRINGQGLLDDSGKNADAAVTLHPQAVHALLQGSVPQWQDIAVSGDYALALNLLALFTQLRYRPRQDIHRLFGRDAASAFDQAAGRVVPVLRGVAELLDTDSPYSRLQRENAELRRRLEHLEQRLSSYT